MADLIEQIATEREKWLDDLVKGHEADCTKIEELLAELKTVRAARDAKWRVIQDLTPRKRRGTPAVPVAVAADQNANNIG